ncbi:MAG: HAD-IIA family hydrolase [Puniceicoccales bacterium]|jgi:NagD protein|nr:HAD-IIA family hydrolase [Puniceicoccales bacterium]
MISTSEKAAYLLDMDGVIYRENILIPGARELIDQFRESNVPFLFLTNNSMPTQEDLVVKLAHLGIPGLTPEHFYTSALNTADFLRTVQPASTAFVVGEGGIVSALRDAHIPHDNMHPTYVIVGEGTPTVEKLNRAHELLERGARFVVTNPDNWCPAGPDKTRPGAGALAAYLEASTGVRAYYLGKPNPFMYACACQRLLKGRPELSMADVFMVGDTMETDIRGAVEYGLKALLVLTGSTRLEDLENYVYQPTAVIADVRVLGDHLRNKQPLENLHSLHERAGIVRERSSVDRHQAYVPDLRYRRARPAMTK